MGNKRIICLADGPVLLNLSDEFRNSILNFMLGSFHVWTTLDIEGQESKSILGTREQTEFTSA